MQCVSISPSWSHPTQAATDGVHDVRFCSCTTRNGAEERGLSAHVVFRRRKKERGLSAHVVASSFLLCVPQQLQPGPDTACTGTGPAETRTADWRLGQGCTLASCHFFSPLCDKDHIKVIPPAWKQNALDLAHFVRETDIAAVPGFTLAG